MGCQAASAVADGEDMEEEDGVEGGLSKVGVKTQFCAEPVPK